MFNSYTWDGYYRWSEAEKCHRGHRLWVRGCQSATMEVKRCQSGADE